MRMESVFFYIGCAVGFDMMAAHTILEQRKQYPDMVLVAVVPYVGQDVYFNKEDKQRYADILRQADKVVVLSEYYYAQCYAHRKHSINSPFHSKNVILLL